ncbi:hypothetical protein Pcinc_011600 [Petrolisthes cinctipes]|uniref:Uncharacterized protein n=1 Tax=Petrolisthes cinctipes TaxID=88211 RepID=A0AAE1G3A8_PETCI|nr:hypothetical protein Pcinc_011600 [Petrolisthes cinctipes]
MLYVNMIKLFLSLKAYTLQYTVSSLLTLVQGQSHRVVCVGTVTGLTQLRPGPLEAPSLPDPEQISDRQSSVRMCANKSLLPTLLDTCRIGTHLSTLQMNPAA